MALKVLLSDECCVTTFFVRRSTLQRARGVNGMSASQNFRKKDVSGPCWGFLSTRISDGSCRQEVVV